jgi:hypothetical protein
MYRYTSPEFRVTQRKGDVAVAQAVATFTRLGTDVPLPLTESAAYDLVIDASGALYRVQVRYCSGREVGLRRIHSNSQCYVVKKIKEDAFDWLYVLDAQGSEFLIVENLANRTSITLREEYRLENVFPVVCK